MLCVVAAVGGNTFLHDAPEMLHTSYARRAPHHYGLIKMCLSHLQDAFCDCALDTYTAVPWAHIQPGPGHIQLCLGHVL